eukprot:g20103.t1
MRLCSVCVWSVSLYRVSGTMVKTSVPLSVNRNRRYDIILPERQIVRKAVKMYQRRVVPAACVVGYTTPLPPADDL